MGASRGVSPWTWLRRTRGMLALGGLLLCASTLGLWWGWTAVGPPEGVWVGAAFPRPPQASPTASAFFVASPNATPTATPWRPQDLTPTVLPSATPTSTPTFTPTPTPTPTPPLPPRAEIHGIRGHAQRYNLSCESASAVDWAAYFGVSLSETEFLHRLPRSDNPNKGFVGDPNGRWGQVPPGDYGVYARPVAGLLRSYGLPARAVYGMSWDALRAEIAAGRPVIVWVVGYVWTHIPPQTYRARDGEEVVVVPYEHTMMVIGYTPRSVILLNGPYRTVVPLERFLASWRVLGNMAVVWDGKK